MSPVIEVVGWALIHFVWQASGLGLATAIAMRICQRPSTRYIVACLGLAAMLAAPIVTIVAATVTQSRTLTVSGSALPDARVAIDDGDPATVAPAANLMPAVTKAASPRDECRWRRTR